MSETTGKGTPAPRTMAGRGKCAWGNTHEARTQVRIALEKLVVDPDAPEALMPTLRLALQLLTKAEVKLFAIKRRVKFQARRPRNSRRV